ncbi:MAG: 16S rRNA (guanine(966)-N(2))-methyltransferase RsmD [Gammaproteobacteria bacterium]|nr:16S rRNA (guanine(966)-N(2))-methyltransferase RsmD [Gammaproteobacteria bacterium]
MSAPALSQLRIIGGRWRGRPVHFIAFEGVRPTPDRVRETLFNWLQGQITGRRCLDLFAGSGALGIEALSRQAASVTFIDSSPSVVQQLRQQLQHLGGDADPSAVVVKQQLAGSFLTREVLSSAAPCGGFDLVFLDPPFHTNLLPELLRLLQQNAWLNPAASIYYEAGSPLNPQDLPDAAWQIRRSQRAGQVYYGLIDTPN